MTEPSPERLDKIQRMTSALVDQVLDAQVMGRAVSREQAVALAQAASLMQDFDIEWPPMMEQALHGLADSTKRESEPAQDEAASVIEGLSRFLGGFRKDRGPG